MENEEEWESTCGDDRDMVEKAAAVGEIDTDVEREGGKGRDMEGDLEERENLFLIYGSNVSFQYFTDLVLLSEKTKFR